MAILTLSSNCITLVIGPGSLFVNINVLKPLAVVIDSGVEYKMIGQWIVDLINRDNNLL